MATEIPVKSLGQSGFRLTFPEAVVYVDPYLTDNVCRLEGAAMGRQVPISLRPDEVSDADIVLVTHIHLDHCDVTTLEPLSRASPACRFICPADCLESLREAGIDPSRLQVAPEAWQPVGAGLRLVAVPAAHPVIERDVDGRLRYVGYVIESAGRRLYHAGDTSPDPELIRRVMELAPIDTAFLPVNERNYYREARGIIGNMTVREAFQLAADLKVRTLVPMHWDMFAPNSVYREEIELLYRMMKPPFAMRIYPDRV